jgi:hypothetical protein
MAWNKSRGYISRRRTGAAAFSEMGTEYAPRLGGSEEEGFRLLPGANIEILDGLFVEIVIV